MSEGNNTTIVAEAVTDDKLDKINIPLSGFGAAESDIELGAKKITDLANPISDQDAATKNYVDKASEINSVTLGEEITTSSTENSLVSGMTLTPSQGTYLVLFNGQMSSVSSFSSNQAAVALGANTTMEGRIYAVTGALTMGANSSLTAPTDISSVNLGILSSFAMYSASGAVSGCATCQVTGDVGTGLGAITGFSNITGMINPAGTVSGGPHVTTYSIYQNGEEVLYSKRIIDGSNAVVSLQALVTVTSEDDTIEIRWKVDSGTSVTGGRTLSLLRSGN